MEAEKDDFQLVQIGVARLLKSNYSTEEALCEAITPKIEAIRTLIQERKAEALGKLLLEETYKYLEDWAEHDMTSP